MKKPLQIVMVLVALVFVLNITFSSNAYAVRPPELALKAIASLASLNAALTICFQSNEYKKLGNESAINLHRLSSRIEDLVVKIQDQYSDSRLLSGYHLLVNEHAVSQDFRIRQQEQFGSPCGSNIYTKIESQFRDEEHSIRVVLFRN